MTARITHGGRFSPVGAGGFKGGAFDIWYKLLIDLTENDLRSVDDLVDRIFDNPLGSGGFEPWNNHSYKRFVDNRIHVDPIRV